MRLRTLKNISCFIVMFCMFFSSVICVKAADRISWNKKMISGGNILYWVSTDVAYASNIRAAETEIEIPAAGYKNSMKLSKTTEKKQSQMDFYQYSDANSSTVAYTYILISSRLTNSNEC